MQKKFDLSKSIKNAINNRKETLKDVGGILMNIEVEQPSKEAVKPVRHVTGKINGKVSKKKLKLTEAITGAINNNKPEADVPNILTSEGKAPSKELDELLFSDKQLRKIASDNAEHFKVIHSVYLDVVFGSDFTLEYDKYGTEDCIQKDCYYVTYKEHYAGYIKKIEIEFNNLLKLEEYLIREWNLI